MGLELKLDFPVQVQLPIGNPTQRPIFEFEKIKFVAARGQLTFFLMPEDPEQVNKSILTAAKILELLAHTPVTGFGFNFSHEIEEPCISLRKTFSASDISVLLDDDDAKTVGQRWGSSIATKNYLFNLHAELEGNKVLLEENMHFETSSALSACALLRGEELFVSVEKVATGVAQKLHDLPEGAL